MKCLLIEDDETVRHFIEKGLHESNHVCDSAADGKQGLLLATSEHYDVLILDRMLPQMDGLTLLDTFRSTNTFTPVLILSAQNKVDDKVKGLRSGADDYLTKPFAFEELLARLELLVQRAATQSSKDIEVTLTAADLSLNLLTRQVTRSSQTIDLQGREFRLLEYMMRNKGRVITRTMLLEKVWDYHFDPQTNVIDVHISRLRQKIDKGFSSPLIETVRGAGYRLHDKLPDVSAQ
ncbi:response regulator transcription factor [Alteromonas oceanisediminis]|uniref:response regulator transcription factor n=1 Tax=Alteromonas oceanisediminis TaxID=2836180 RepID=UPI001BD95798|nr:response regulator transcription factor [Alteromonas oceanisediminis]MBT0585474.1 response regulator transcription factor [Alteromonas oceanisediminis]